MSLPPLSPSLLRGSQLIAHVAQTLPSQPGVYRMLGQNQQVLYVGKAKNLQRRVLSYTQVHALPQRLKRMVSETFQMEFITTHTEAEALLLEANLIKKLEPQYNILLRDDKSSPYILVTQGHLYPQLLKHRGAKTVPGKYFGPFASPKSVADTLTALQKAFLLRNCSDSFFSQRKRPCLQYQIKRCSAPCVGKISPEDYKNLVKEALDFLHGKEATVQQTLAEKMKEASEALDYETAALYRDRIRGLTQIQSHQSINLSENLEGDVIGISQKAGQTCVQIFFFRSGRHYGNQSYFPSHGSECSLPEILESFLAQFYAHRSPPPEILVGIPLEEKDLLSQALSLNRDYKVKIQNPLRGVKASLVEQATRNAQEALIRHMAQHESQRQLLEGVAQAFQIPSPLNRIEVYDNSHIQGASPYGAMIVAGPEGFIKRAYRAFSIQSSQGGDDYHMMREVMRRRFREGKKKDVMPDLLLIDGGLGQLHAVLEVLEEKGLSSLPVVAIAKGPQRNAGREKFFMKNRTPFSLSEKDPVLYYLQRLRDEAHRFVITTHRRKRTKQMVNSVLETIPQVGESRRQALLNHFGSVQAVLKAGVRDLEAVPGISKKLAEKLYNFFQNR